MKCFWFSRKRKKPFFNLSNLMSVIVFCYISASHYINFSSKRGFRGESHIDFRTQYVIVTQVTWPPPCPPRPYPPLSAICVISRFLTKLIVYFTYNCWLAFFLFLCGFQEKIKPADSSRLQQTEVWSTIPEIHRIHLYWFFYSVITEI